MGKTGPVTAVHPPPPMTQLGHRQSTARICSSCLGADRSISVLSASGRISSYRRPGRAIHHSADLGCGRRNWRHRSTGLHAQATKPKAYSVVELEPLSGGTVSTSYLATVRKDLCLILRKRLPSRNHTGSESVPRGCSETSETWPLGSLAWGYQVALP